MKASRNSTSGGLTASRWARLQQRSFFTTVDLWLAEAPYQAEPLFVSVGLENFVDSPDWNEANKRGVRYLREQAQHHKLVFTSAADIAGYFERHYAVQPENWLVWPDVYAGQPGEYKPRQLPDRIEVSNAQFHSVHEDGASLPRFFWDFTRAWSEPVWDDQSAIRKKFGLVKPGPAYGGQLRSAHGESRGRPGRRATTATRP